MQVEPGCTAAGGGHLHHAQPPAALHTHGAGDCALPACIFCLPAAAWHLHMLRVSMPALPPFSWRDPLPPPCNPAGAAVAWRGHRWQRQRYLCGPHSDQPAHRGCFDQVRREVGGWLRVELNWAAAPAPLWLAFQMWRPFPLAMMVCSLPIHLLPLHLQHLGSHRWLGQRVAGHRQPCLPDHPCCCVE